MIKSSPRNETKPPIWPSSVRAAVRGETTSPVSVPISSERAIGIWSGIKINETKRNETGADHLKEPLLEGGGILPPLEEGPGPWPSRRKSSSVHFFRTSSSGGIGLSGEGSQAATHPSWWVDRWATEASQAKNMRRQIELYRKLFAEARPRWWLIFCRYIHQRCCSSSSSAPPELERDRGVEWWDLSGWFFFFMRFGMVMVLIWPGYVLIFYAMKICDDDADDDNDNDDDGEEWDDNDWGQGINKQIEHFSKYSFRRMTLRVFVYYLPYISSTAAVIVTSWTFLPRKFRECIEAAEATAYPRNSDDLMLFMNVSDVHHAAAMSGRFMLIWLVWGFMCYGISRMSTHLFSPIALYIEFMVIFSSAPTLSAVLFTLSLDVARARKVVVSLEEGAEKETLTVEQYRLAGEQVKNISGGWKRYLMMLASVSLYNTISLGINVWASSPLGTQGADLVYELQIIGALSKEAVLLFILASISRRVNDAADDIVADVFRWEEKPTRERARTSNASVRFRNRSSVVSAPENPEENGKDALARINQRLDALEQQNESLDHRNQRLELIAEGANFLFLDAPIDKAQRTYMRRRIFARKARGGIRFEVLGIRWTSRYVFALGASYAITAAYYGTLYLSKGPPKR
jgi:hypothetical protein